MNRAERWSYDRLDALLKYDLDHGPNENQHGGTEVMTDRDNKGQFLPECTPGPGRKSKYDPAMDDQAYRLALLGLTDERIAAFFDIHIDTFYTWRHSHIGFSDAVNRGKQIADANVAHGLYQRAIGITVTSEKAYKGKNGEVVIAQTKTQIPPDPGAAMNWLKNRQRDLWGKKDEDAPEGPGAPESLSDMSDEELQSELDALRKRRAHEG